MILQKSVSQFRKDVAACLAFGSGVCFVNRIFYFLPEDDWLHILWHFIYSMTDLFSCSPRAECVDQMWKYKYARYQALVRAG